MDNRAKMFSPITPTTMNTLNLLWLASCISLNKACRVAIRAVVVTIALTDCFFRHFFGPILLPHYCVRYSRALLLRLVTRRRCFSTRQKNVPCGFSIVCCCQFFPGEVASCEFSEAMMLTWILISHAHATREIKIQKKGSFNCQK